MFVSLFVCMYEAHVKSKFRYKIYLAMNDVTSMSCVSLVRQFETLLFYVSHQQNRGTCCIVSQVLWMPVSKKSTACCCNQLFTVVSTSAVSENVDFQSQSGAQFSVTHSGKNSARSVMDPFEIGSHDAGATAAFVVVHVIWTTFKLPTPSSNHTATHRFFSIDLTHLPVNIGWLDILGL